MIAIKLAYLFGLKNYLFLSKEVQFKASLFLAYDNDFFFFETFLEEFQIEVPTLPLLFHFILVE
jgi:hypothetical protein